MSDRGYRRSLSEALDLAEQLGDGQRAAKAALAMSWGFADLSTDERGVTMFERALALLDTGDDVLRARVMATLGQKLRLSGPDRERRFYLSDEALGMARRLGDPATLAHVLRARFETIHSPETLQERRANNAELRDLARAGGDPHTEAIACLFESVACGELGNGDDVDAAIEAALSLGKSSGQSIWIWAEPMWRAHRALGTGDLAAGERFMEAAAEAGGQGSYAGAAGYMLAELYMLRREQGRLADVVGMWELLSSDPGAGWAAQSLVAYALVDLGDLDGARKLLAVPAASGFLEIPVGGFWIIALCNWAYVAAAVNDDVAATALLDLLVVYKDRYGMELGQDSGPVTYYLGMLSATLGEFDAADAYFAAAVDQCARMRSVWTPRVQYEWAQVLVRRDGPGDRARALELLDTGLETARAMNVPASIARGEALQQELAGR